MVPRSRAPGRLVLAAVVAAAVAAGGCAMDEGFYIDTRPCAHTFHLSEPYDPSLRLHVESCLLDGDACLALCRLVLARVGVDDPFLLVHGCDVRGDGDGVEVVARYEELSCDLPGGSP